MDKFSDTSRAIVRARLFGDVSDRDAAAMISQLDKAQAQGKECPTLAELTEAVKQ